MRDLEQLYDALATPTPAVEQDLSELGGDLVIIGVAGKLGPEMAIMAARALRAVNSSSRVIGVARNASVDLVQRLSSEGVVMEEADLSHPDALRALPDAAAVVYLAGRKFGTTGDEPGTWLINTYLSGRVAERYAGAAIVAFSTGNVYPLLPVVSGGATESTIPAPVGEYAASALGRERVMAAICERSDTPLSLLRLNYAVEMRYGVLLEIARDVWHERPIDVTNGAVNVIWQGDVNAAALRSIRRARCPAQTWNITGPETLSVRSVAARFGELMGRTPQIVGTESPDALLSNAGRYFKEFGYPTVAVEQLIDWTAGWVAADLPTHDKPTHFATRDGRF